jgi:hypothetical protein
MMRVLLFVVCACFFLPLLAAADEPEHNEEWLVELRHSGSYKKGLEQVREKIEFAYDVGAIRGASQWDAIHGYFIELARAKGCKKGAPFADGPVKECHVVSRAEPKLLGPSYKKGREEIIALSRESLYAALVRKVLFVIYDYGYVQGAKHSLRKYNDDLLWARTYYKSCVARANDAEHEPACADASKAWSEALLNRLGKQVESHGLPVGKKPE